MDPRELRASALALTLLVAACAAGSSRSASSRVPDARASGPAPRVPGTPRGQAHHAAQTPTTPRRPETAPGKPSGPGTELELVDTALDDGQIELAREHLARARKLGASAADLTLYSIKLELAATGVPPDYAAAPGDTRLERLLDELEPLVETDPRARLERGRILLMLGRAEAALLELRQAAAELPKEPEAESALGVALLGCGKVPEALEAMSRAVDLDPNNAARLTNLGTAQLVSGRVNEAVATFNKVVRLQPGDARARSDLGTALLSAGDPQAALLHLERAVAIAPDRATFVSNLGYAYLELGDPTRAINTFRRAISLDPKLGSAWINLGIALSSEKSYDAAEAAFRKALEIDPRDPRAQSNLQDLRQLRSGGVKAGPSKK
jgi:Flp pilus assembly protein TadD